MLVLHVFLSTAPPLTGCQWLVHCSSAQQCHCVYNLSNSAMSDLVIPLQHLLTCHYHVNVTAVLWMLHYPNNVCCCLFTGLPVKVSVSITACKVYLILSYVYNLLTGHYIAVCSCSSVETGTFLLNCGEMKSISECTSQGVKATTVNIQLNILGSTCVIPEQVQYLGL